MPDEKLTVMPNLGSMGAADRLYAVDDPGGAPAEVRLEAQVLRAYIGQLDILHVREEYSSGTTGPNSLTLDWKTRVLNTVVTNLISGASLASDQITLPAGTYRVRAHCGVFDVDRHKCRLRNITDGVTELVGGTDFAQNSDLSMTTSYLFGRFTIAAEKVFELQHYTQVAKTTGFGVPVSSGEVEVYAQVMIEQEPA